MIYTNKSKITFLVMYFIGKFCVNFVTKELFRKNNLIHSILMIDIWINILAWMIYRKNQ